MKNIKKNIIKRDETVFRALELINIISDEYPNEPLVLFIANCDNQIIGSLTDGDIRRGITRGKNLELPVSDFMNESFYYLQEGAFTIDEVDDIRNKSITLAPVLNSSKQLVKIIDFNKTKTVLPVDAFIMAGGKGTRLRPLTEKTPKPLLQIGDKPIIEYNIDRLISYGIENIYISINYLGDQIRDYFGDGSDKGIHIHYVEEEKPLGTLGSVTIGGPYQHENILLMNSDLLTTIDFENLYRSFTGIQADMTVASVPYEVQIPYAVIETNGNGVKSFKEKPDYTYYSNAGIYLIKKKLLEDLPENSYVDATDFMEKLIQEGKNLTYFPILGYWLDIGKHVDYEKAKKDICLLGI